jgi:hypothetical protein
MTSYFTKTELRKRGWTETLIDRFLPEPDEERVNPHYKSGPPMSLYLQDRVLKKEKNKTFQAAQTKRKAIKEAVEKRLEKEKKTPVPILPALFTLNRRAKRCRDLAQKYYRRRKHGFAQKAREEKETIYGLKGQVLHHLVASGVLSVIGYHRFLGEQGEHFAEILAGEGYSFHRPCDPPEVGGVHEIRESIEARPKGAKEPTLTAAYSAVNLFLKGKKFVDVFEWQRRERVQYVGGKRDDDGEEYERND